MTHGHKPRAIKEPKSKPALVRVDIKPIQITDPKKLPKSYIAIKDNWDDQWMKNLEEKLNKRGMHIKKPFTIYELTRIVKSVELCLEVGEGVAIQ